MGWPTGCRVRRRHPPPRIAAFALPRLTFRTPDRSDLPPLARYATLQADGASKVVGYTEGTRGCKHRCRHCPIVPVYDGHFRVVAAEVVMADIAAQVAAGAQHITFGDPDFFNGPRHAMAIVEGLAARASRPHLRRDDQGRAPAASTRPAPAAPRHRLRVCHHRGGIVRQSRSRVAREGTHARGLRTGRPSLPDHRSQPLADLRRVHTVDDDGELRVHAVDARSARSRGRRGPGSIRDPVADTGRLPDARARRGEGSGRHISIASRSRTCGATTIRASTRCSGSSRRWPVRGSTRRAKRCSRRSGPGCTMRRGSPCRCGRPRAGTDAMPYLNEPWYCCAEPNAEQVTLV